MEPPLIFAGIMSGTSLDGIDAVLVDFTQDTCQLLDHCSHSFTASERIQLKTLAESENLTFTQLAEAEDFLTRSYARALNLLRQRHPDLPLLAAGCHGQTLEHRPNATPAYTLQLLNPSLLAELTQLNIVADFRRRDLAAGGQGAPLVPAFHQAVFQNSQQNRILLNLGGIANLTWLPADPDQPVTGFDSGPANLLLDGIAQTRLNQPFDRDGLTAQQGTIHTALLQQLLSEAYFALPPPKSTGRETFNLNWLEQQLTRTGCRNIPTADLLATLTELTAQTASQAMDRVDPLKTATVYACGGGSYNTQLMRRLQAAIAPRSLQTTQPLGIDPQLIEATAFAWLAKQQLQGKPGNLPSVTGARGLRCLGGFYPA